jgi:hypothetical protein
LEFICSIWKPIIVSSSHHCRHPNFPQLYGISRSSALQATIFHDGDLSTWTRNHWSYSLRKPSRFDTLERDDDESLRVPSINCLLLGVSGMYCTISFKSAVTHHAPPCQSRTLVEVTRRSGLCRTSKWSQAPNCLIK